MPNRIEGDFHVNGTITAKAVQLPASTVEADDVKAGAGIEVTKLEHQHQKQFHLETPANTTTSVHVAYGATGTILGFSAGARQIATTGSLTVDLLNGGSSVLSSTITLNTAQTNFQVVDATISSASLVVDDVLEVKVVDSSSDAVGVFAAVTLKEDAV